LARGCEHASARIRSPISGRIERLLGAATAASITWGVFESQWVRCVTYRLPVACWPQAAPPLRIAHLSDLHIGAPSLNSRALRKGIDLILAAAPDLILISGDLRARRSGTAVLIRQLRRLEAPLGSFAVLGNHDYGDGLDPFADGEALADLAGTSVRLLSDEAVDVSLAGTRIRIAGLSPRRFVRDRRVDGHVLADASADLAILICHFPGILDRVRRGDFDLVVAGHLHGGQICVPLPTGKVRLAHLSRAYLEGIYQRDGTVMHVTRGVGTTFVPLRFAARPEVAVLELVSG
jgi:predicted MPP superfamily phosphohydrolase